MDKKRFDTDRLNKLSILSAAEQLGIHIGRGKKVLCFIHSEKTPSLSFDSGKNRWHCFGCGAGGGVIDLVMQYTGTSFSNACEWLESVFGISNNDYLPIKRSSNPRTEVALPDKVPIDSELYSSIIGELLLGDKATEYLCQARALSTAVVKQNHIRSLDNIAVFYKNIIARYGEERLLNAGLLKVSKLSDLKRSWWCSGIIFPYYAYNGELVNLQLRPYSASRAKYMFLNGIPTAIYNEHSLKHWDTGDTIFLCEGAMDTLSMLTKGYKAVGIPGVNSFQDAWFNYIGRFNVIILFDNDASGIKNAKTLSERLSAKNINAQVQHVPSCYKDINAMLIAERE